MKNNYMYPNIEAERIRMGLSQTEIISCLGYKERKTYYNWLESGNIPVSVLMKWQICLIVRLIICLAEQEIPYKPPKPNQHPHNQ